MSRADDLLNNVQKAVGDKPLLLLAGAGDLVSSKLRELPEAINAWQAENRDFPMKAAGALIGSAFRVNLKVGELYDELLRRGQDVMGGDAVAEEDEPFVHEPFMPEPVRAPVDIASRRATSKRAASKRAAASAADSASASSTSKKSSTGAKKTAAADAKKSGTSAATKPAKKSAAKKAATKAPAARKSPQP